MMDSNIKKIKLKKRVINRDMRSRWKQESEKKIYGPLSRMHKFIY